MPIGETGFGGTYVVAGSNAPSISPINRSRFVRDSTLVIRTLLSGNITDPENANRASNEQFMMVEWMDRPARYPVITIEQVGFESNRIGMQSDNSIANVNFELNVWSKSTAQTDSLAGSIFAVLDQNGYTLSRDGLHNGRFLGMQNLDEPGPAGVHRKRIEIAYTWLSET